MRDFIHINLVDMNAREAKRAIALTEVVVTLLYERKYAG